MINTVGRFFVGIFAGGVAAMGGAVILTIVGTVLGGIVAGLAYLWLSALGIEPPSFAQKTLSRFITWAYAVVCSVAFCNTFCCVLFQKDNILNAFCLTQDEQSKTE